MIALSLLGVLALSADGGAHLGLAVRDVAGVGCMVSWIDPGPLDGRGIESATLRRPDLIVAFGEEPASGASLERILAAAAPDDTILIRYRRALAPGPGFPAAVAHEEEIRSLEVRLADRARWTGTFGGDPLPLMRAAERVEPQLLAPKGDGLFATALRETGLEADLDGVLDSLKAVAARDVDRRRLSRIGIALESPLALPELADACVSPTRSIATRPWATAARLAAEHLDAIHEPGEGHGSIPVPHPRGAINALNFLMNGARLPMEQALGERFANEDFARAAIATALHLRGSLLIRGPQSESMLEVIRAGAEIDVDALVAAMAHLDAELGFVEGWAEGEPEELPEALRDAVEGSVISAEEIPGVGWSIVGGPGPNRYDMSVVAAVIDIGGDDEYRIADLALGMRCVIDLAGDDRYLGSELQGFGAGVCGLFMVDDRAGNDAYVGGALHAGVGLFGAGILLDRAGDDRYEGGTWTQGAALWGAGLLIDLAGADDYRCDYFGQGVGGARGFGALVDAAGNDRYDAEGTRESLYGTPGVRASFSQGVGVGIRRFAAGGIGVLADLAGDDRYQAGEFAQGGGYFLGLGILHDAAGDDRYLGNRYGQGFAAHQAAGILVDRAGDDAYLGWTAANQGAAWDQSVAMLVDLAGDDHYAAHGLAQGAAAQQALAVLYDAGGRDTYLGRGASVQGTSGTNEYHFDRPPPFGGIGSFSVLIDLARAGERPEDNRFSSGRPLGRPMKTDSEAELPAGNRHGLFLAVPAPNP